MGDAGASVVLVNSNTLRDKMAECTSQTAVLVGLSRLMEESLTNDASTIRRNMESITITLSNVAYAVYTSGSTGKPKGILVEHRQIATSVVEHAPRIGITPEGRKLQLASLTFDVRIGDVIYAFFVGACLCVPFERVRTDDIAGAITWMGANFLWATPTHATLLTPKNTPSLRTTSLIREPIRLENIET